MPLLAPTWLVDAHPGPGRLNDVVMVQVDEASWRDGVVEIPGAERSRVPGFLWVEGEAAELLERLQLHPAVRAAWLPFAPAPPPEPRPDPNDIPPVTPEFPSDWLGPAPGGMAISEGRWWPGGFGGATRVADLEYAWDATHESLLGNPPTRVYGEPWSDYAAHGTAVLGLVGAARDGFGLTGGVPDAALWVVHPHDDLGRYRVADAIAAATELLAPGDVLLIEQQAFSAGGYLPVSADPAVHAAIRLAVQAGISVVEPGANGAQDLDDPAWEGWFDRGNDPGSILVGGGHPGTTPDARAWAGGSSHGDRVDVQGWMYGVPAPVDGVGLGADLFYPGGDPRQAYTSSFGGTSAASAQVAAVVAQLQSISMALHGAPVPPETLRGWLRETGWPQPPHDAALHPIGPAPDVRAMVRTYLAP